MATTIMKSGRENSSSTWGLLETRSAMWTKFQKYSRRWQSLKMGSPADFYRLPATASARLPAFLHTLRNMPNDQTADSHGAAVTVDFVRQRNVMLVQADLGSLLVDYYLHQADHHLH